MGLIIGYIDRHPLLVVTWLPELQATVHDYITDHDGYVVTDSDGNLIW